MDAMQYLFTDGTWAFFEPTCGDMSMGNIPEIDAISAKAASMTSLDGRQRYQTRKVVSSTPKLAYVVDRKYFRETLIRGIEKHNSYDKALIATKKYPAVSQLCSVMEASRNARCSSVQTARSRSSATNYCQTTRSWTLVAASFTGNHLSLQRSSSLLVPRL